MNKHISIIGGGAMGSALARGLVANGVSPDGITVSNPHLEKLESLRQQGINVTDSNISAVRMADIVVFAVKPWILPGVVEQLTAALDYSTQHIVVIAASISCQALADMFTLADGALPKSLSLVMPNTAMSVSQSMTFVVNIMGDSLPAVHLFEPLGAVMVIDERMLGAATALASCGIAYALRYVRAAVEGGVELGVRAADAQRMVAQTLRGVAALLDRPDAHAEVEIDKVTTPGGLTIRGLNAMEQGGFSVAVIAGLKASLPK